MKRHVRSDWSNLVLVCGKCSKKLDGGFGTKGRTGLAKALRAIAEARGKKRKAAFGVIEVKCLKICPKGAVTVVSGATPGDWQIVAAGTPIPAVAARLGLATPALVEGDGASATADAKVDPGAGVGGADAGEPARADQAAA